MSIAIWAERCRLIRTSNNVVEAVDDYISWLDYIAANVETSTGEEDFDALLSHWVTSDACRIVANQYADLSDALTNLEDYTREYCRRIEYGWIEFPTNFDELSEDERDEYYANEDSAAGRFAVEYEDALDAAREELEAVDFLLNKLVDAE